MTSSIGFVTVNPQVVFMEEPTVKNNKFILILSFKALRYIIVNWTNPTLLMEGQLKVCLQFEVIKLDVKYKLYNHVEYWTE